MPRSLALNEPFQEVRGHIGALTYQIEITKSESSKESMRKEIEELKKEVHTVKLPKADGSTEKIADGLRHHGQDPAGLEGGKGRAAAEARRSAEAGHRTARASATST